MSTPEVTPESLRAHAEWLDEHHGAAEADALRREADRLEREQRPLPTVPGWHPNIVVERGGESCTGALLREDKAWVTARPLYGYYGFHPSVDSYTIRWAEQDGTTPGQTLHAAKLGAHALVTWILLDRQQRVKWERAAAAVLAAHGTPTLTSVGEHPKPGTRGLLPVGLDDGEWGSGELGMFLCLAGSAASRAILADPRPDGAQ